MPFYPLKTLNKVVKLVGIWSVIKRPIPSSFITKTKEAEQTDDHSVNRVRHVQLKGNLEKKMAGWSLRILSSRRTTWQRRFVNKKIMVKNSKINIICVKKKLCVKEEKKIGWAKCVMETQKLKLWQNSKAKGILQKNL